MKFEIKKTLDINVEELVNKCFNRTDSWSGGGFELSFGDSLSSLAEQIEEVTRSELVEHLDAVYGMDIDDLPSNLYCAITTELISGVAKRIIDELTKLIDINNTSRV